MYLSFGDRIFRYLSRELPSGSFIQISLVRESLFFLELLDPIFGAFLPLLLLGRYFTVWLLQEGVEGYWFKSVERG